MHSFIHSWYFYSATSSPLLHRGAPDYSIRIVPELTRQNTTALPVKDLPKVPTRVGFEHATIRTQGIEPTTELPCSTLNFYGQRSTLYLIFYLVPVFVSNLKSIPTEMFV